MAGQKKISEGSIPRFAIALAAFNGILWLKEQLDSILNQTGVSVKVFISIEPSTDGTEEFIATRVTQDPRVVLLPQHGSLQNAACNFYRLFRDVPLDNFDYLAFSDQDDIWMPDKLLRAHTQMQQGNCAAYSSNVTAFWPDGRERLINKAQPMRGKDFLFEAAGPGSTYVFNRTLARDLQNFIVLQHKEVDQVALHDWLFHAFSRSQGYRWFIDSYSGVMYRQHATNHLGANSGFSAFKSRCKSITSGWYHTEIVKIGTLCCDRADPFFHSLRARGWRSRLFVMCHVRQCRRRWLDRLVLFLCCLLGLF